MHKSQYSLLCESVTEIYQTLVPDSESSLKPIIAVYSGSKTAAVDHRHQEKEVGGTGVHQNDSEQLVGFVQRGEKGWCLVLGMCWVGECGPSGHVRSCFQTDFWLSISLETEVTIE